MGAEDVEELIENAGLDIKQKEAVQQQHQETDMSGRRISRRDGRNFTRFIPRNAKRDSQNQSTTPTLINSRSGAPMETGKRRWYSAAAQRRVERAKKLKL